MRAITIDADTGKKSIHKERGSGSGREPLLNLSASGKMLELFQPV